jgi:serine/threonine protein kinase
MYILYISASDFYDDSRWVEIAGSPRPLKIETKIAVEDRQRFFRKWAPLGVGHFGTTYFVKSAFDDTQYALKEVPYGSNSPSDAIAEVQPFLKLNQCDMICRLHAFTIDEPSRRLLLFFTYCRGGDMEKFLNRYRASNVAVRESMLCGWLRRLLLALQAMEHAEFVHIDIAPRNIFFLDEKHEVTSKHLTFLNPLPTTNFSQCIILFYSCQYLVIWV